MAPELTETPPRYTVASEVYSLGVVLLELLMGAAVGPGTATAAELLKAATLPRASPRGVAAFTDRADAAWPHSSRDALAALALRCLAQYEEERPAGMGIIVEQLKAIKGLLQGGLPASAPAVQQCLVCWEEVEVSTGLLCKAAAGAEGGAIIDALPHFLCHGCLQTHVREFMKPVQLDTHHGAVPCASKACPAAPWSVEDPELEAALDKGTLVACFRGLRYVKYDAEDARKKEVARLAAAIEAARGDARKLRAAIVERDLLLRCPRCEAPFSDYEGSLTG